jgi:hypothetical protein
MTLHRATFTRRLGEEAICLHSLTHRLGIIVNIVPYLVLGMLFRRPVALVCMVGNALSYLGTDTLICPSLIFQ